MRAFNTDFILKEKRYSWIDYDKGISIILVAYGHCLSILSNHDINLNDAPVYNYIGDFLYGFRMPLFFIISGIFLSGSLSRKGFSGYVYGRTNNILYPLLVWGFLEITILVYFIYKNQHVFSSSLYLKLFTNPRDIGIGHLWYLNTLFTIGVVYAFLKVKLNIPAKVLLVVGLVLYSVSAYIHINDINVGMLTDVCQYFLFFSLGDLVSSTALNEHNAKRFASVKVFIPIFLVFLGLQYYCTTLNYHSGIGTDFVEHKKPFLFLVQALVGCVLSVNVSFQLQKHKILRFLRVIGYNSLYIYCMQIIFMSIGYQIMTKLFHVGSIPILIMGIMFAGVIAPIFFYNFCLRFNLWRLFYFIKPEKEIASLAPKKQSLTKAAA